MFQVVRQSGHSLRVCLLYRRILKEQQAWLAHREQWNEVSTNTRNAFKAQKEVPKHKAELLVKDAEEQLKYWKHPNPIINPHSEGGVCYQRNAPPPYDLTMPEAFVEWR